MSQSGMIMEFVHRRRRGAELFLLVLALAVGVGAYAAVGLGVEGEVPTGLLTYGGWLAGLVVVAHVVVRFVAPYADPVDPEAARYAPRPPRRFVVARRVLAGVAVVGVAWIAGAAAYSWSQQQFYVGVHDGTVTIFRGVDADIPGVNLSQPYETTNVTLARLSDYDASTVREGIDADNLDDAQEAVRRLAANQTIEDATDDTDDTGDATAEATATPSDTATPSPTDSLSATP